MLTANDISIVSEMSELTARDRSKYGTFPEDEKPLFSDPSYDDILEVIFCCDGYKTESKL